MADRTIDDYTFSVDWSDISTGIKLGHYCRQINFKITAKFTFSITATMGGEKKMSPKERSVLTRLNEARAKSVHDATAKELQESVDALEERLDKIRHDKSIKSDARKTAFQKESSEAEAQINACLKSAQASLETIVTKNINGYVKGKHHFRKKVVQIVKHSVKIPVSIAAIPAGIALSFTGFAAPIGISASLAAIGNIKQCFDYIKVHKQGMAGLEERIKKNIAFVEPTAMEYADAAERLEEAERKGVKDDEARKKLKLVKHDINQREIAAYAFETFMSVHKKSIEHLSDLVDKYRKKINKHKYEAIHMGRQIEKLEDSLASITKSVSDDKSKLANMKKSMGKGAAEALEREWDKIEKAIKTGETKIASLPVQISSINKALDAEIEKVSKAEESFEAWAAQVELFKSQRPKAVHDWKKGIKAIALLKFAGETALGGASDALGGVSKTIEIVSSSVGAVQTTYDAVSSNLDDVKAVIEKATS